MIRAIGTVPPNAAMSATDAPMLAPHKGGALHLVVVAFGEIFDEVEEETSHNGDARGNKHEGRGEAECPRSCACQRGHGERD